MPLAGGWSGCCGNYVKLEHMAVVRFPEDKETRDPVHARLAKKIAARKAWKAAGHGKRRRNPPEPIVLVHYGPWHFFFAIFLEIVISSGRSEPTVVIKLLPNPWKKKERAHGSFQRSWASL